MPEFSVVIPAHNRPEFLREAIESVERQTITDWEILVVDDGSEPQLEITDRERIRVVRHAASRGPAAARNSGVAAARGANIAFLDDDDLFTPERLEIAREGLEHTPLATCWIKMMDEPLRHNVVLQGDVRDTILNQLTPSPGATAVRRAAFLPFDETLSGVEDVDWWLRMAATNEVTTVPRVGYLVRRWRTTTDAERARQIRNRVDENLAMLARYAEYFETHPAAEAFRLKRVGLMLMDLRDYEHARRVFLRSLQRRPDLRTARHWVASCRRSAAAPI